MKYVDAFLFMAPLGALGGGIVGGMFSGGSHGVMLVGAIVGAIAMASDRIKRED